MRGVSHQISSSGLLRKLKNFNRRFMASIFVCILVFHLGLMIAASSTAYASKEVDPASNPGLSSEKQTSDQPTLEKVSDQIKRQAEQPDDIIPDTGKNYQFKQGIDTKAIEDTSKRSETSKVMVNPDGRRSVITSNEPMFYQKNDSWLSIEGTLKDDVEYNQKNAAKETFTQKLLPGKPNNPVGFKQSDGKVKTSFRNFGDAVPTSVASEASNVNIGIKPLGTNSINPNLETNTDGSTFVSYANAWDNVDLFYEQRGATIKEYIKLNSITTQNWFSFAFSGATSLTMSADGKTVTVVARDGLTYVIPELSLSSMKTGPISNPQGTNKSHNLLKVES